MVAHPQPPRCTVEAYLEMERGSPIKHEYLDGHGSPVDVYRRAGEQWTQHSFGPGDEVILESITTSIPANAFYERIALERT